MLQEALANSVYSESKKREYLYEKSNLENVLHSVKEWFVCLFVCLFDLGLTSLSTIFQSYRDGVWM